MLGLVFSVIAGLVISLQSIFGTRISEKVGIWENTAIVHFIGLIFALIFLLLFGSGNIKKVTEVNPLYLLAGLFGAIIITSVVKGITILGPALAISIVLVSQLVFATIIEVNGWFGVTPMIFSLTKFLGLVLMVVGIGIFKFL